MKKVLLKSFAIRRGETVQCRIYSSDDFKNSGAELPTQEMTMRGILSKVVNGNSIATLHSFRDGPVTYKVNLIQPADFQWALRRLLKRMKIDPESVIISTKPPVKRPAKDVIVLAPAHLPVDDMDRLSFITNFRNDIPCILTRHTSVTEIMNFNLIGPTYTLNQTLKTCSGRDVLNTVLKDHNGTAKIYLNVLPNRPDIRDILVQEFSGLAARMGLDYEDLAVSPVFGEAPSTTLVIHSQLSVTRMKMILDENADVFVN